MLSGFKERIQRRIVVVFPVFHLLFDLVNGNQVVGVHIRNIS